MIFASLIVVPGGKFRVMLTHNLAAWFVCVNIWGIDEERLKQNRVIGILGLGWFRLLKDDGQSP